MNNIRRAGAGAAFLALVLTAPVAAQQADSAELERVKRQVEALSAQLEALQLGEDVVKPADSSVHGFGPAASKVYRASQGVSIGGYGEFVYENYAATREDGEDRAHTVRDQLDALRAILYVGYKFNEKWLLNTEIEFEHASTGQGGEVSVEFAYLDYLASPHLGVRAGMVLVPMGFVNELHEPTTFFGTTRPLTESTIIPTTWRENGAGIFGDIGDFSYRAYVINGLDAVGGGSSKASGFSAAGLRGGRQKGARAIIETPALVARVDYSSTLVPGLLLGGSIYTGDSGNNYRASADAEPLDVPTTIYEGHAQLNALGFDLRGLYAKATLDGVAELNAARTLTGAAQVGEELQGWYVEAGYDVLRSLGTAHQLKPYVRYESLDTQAALPEAVTSPLSTERTALLLGAQWQPITQIVLKGDYQILKNQAETGVNQFNLALGYIF